MLGELGLHLHDISVAFLPEFLLANGAVASDSGGLYLLLQHAFELGPINDIGKGLHSRETNPVLFLLLLAYSQL